MDCIVCRTPGAYIGFSKVECRNPDCRHYVPYVAPKEEVLQSSGIKIYKYIPVNSTFCPMTFIKGGKFYRAAQYDGTNLMPWSYNKSFIDTLVASYEKDCADPMPLFAKLEFDLNTDPGNGKGDNSLISTYFTVKGYPTHSAGFHQCNGKYYCTSHGKRLRLDSYGSDKKTFFHVLNTFHNDSNFEGKIYSESFEHE